MTDAPSDGGPPPPDAPSRPPDLVPQRDAAALVDRSVSTVRGWLREGKLTKYRETPGDPSSRAMVSREELLRFAAGHLEAEPNRPGSAAPEPAPAPPVAPAPASPPLAPEPSTWQAEAGRLRAELAGARAALEATQGTVRALEARAELAETSAAELVAAERRRVEDAHGRCAELREDLEAARAELAGARAELEALRLAAGLPWWRRLLTG